MQYIDLHCDTLYRAVTENKNLYDNDFHISLGDKDSFKIWVQCFAVWIPDDITLEQAQSLYQKAVQRLNTDAYDNSFDIYKGNGFGGKYTAVLTVEGGRLIGSDLSNIKRLADDNVKILTLTWNGDNQIACGAQTNNDTGLTDFGKAAVRELERNKIVVDVSHLSDRSFYDTAENSTAPFVATHSNSRTICNHRRNLTDEQFKIIRDTGGIIGLNFYRDFLSCGKAGIKDIVKHCEHFLSLGGEDTVAIGSDFDGSDMPDDICGIADVPKIYNEFLRLNYSETLVNKIFWANAHNFFETFDNT
ncbi:MULTISPECIES: dipeptidase [unclassified Ruminococcus]|uniref:dipeptidase n=1 Tax=unclassified Ruminococcus TaxID=2608920 RepID=UPI0021086D1C|nr:MULTISPECIES: membrane dipeptidase [unclassified Ruminococcus]